MRRVQDEQASSQSGGGADCIDRPRRLLTSPYLWWAAALAAAFVPWPSPVRVGSGYTLEACRGAVVDFLSSSGPSCSWRTAALLVISVVLASAATTFGLNRRRLTTGRCSALPWIALRTGGTVLVLVSGFLAFWVYRVRYEPLADRSAYPFDWVPWPGGMYGPAVIVLAVGVGATVAGLVGLRRASSAVPSTFNTRVLAGVAVGVSVSGVALGLMVYVERAVSSDWFSRFDLAIRAAGPMLLASAVLALLAAVQGARTA